YPEHQEIFWTESSNLLIYCRTYKFSREKHLLPSFNSIILCNPKMLRGLVISVINCFSRPSGNPDFLDNFLHMLWWRGCHFRNDITGNDIQQHANCPDSFRGDPK